MVLLLLAQVASASGFFLPDSGVRAMGRAGAYTAGADDLSAQYHNPAALIRLDRAFQVQAWGAHHAVGFDREDEGELVFDPVKNSDPPFLIPAMGGAFSFGRDDLTLALGLYTATAATYGWPEDGAQRFALTSSTVLQPRVGPSVAWSPVKGLSLGGGVAWSMLTVEQQVTSTAAVLPTDDMDYDAPVSVSVVDPFALCFSAGLLYEPTESFAVGASFTPSVAYEATGSMEVDLSQNVFYTGETEMGQIVADSSAADEEVVLAVRLPPVLRVGVLYRPVPTWEIEADLVYEGWHTIETLGPSEVDLEIATTGGDPIIVDQDVVLPMTMVDALSARLGAEARVHERWELRFGALYESSAVPEDYRGVLVVDGPKVGVSAGASWQARDNLHIDLGVLRNQHLRQELGSSSLTQITLDPFSGSIGRGKSVGSGTLTAASTLVGLSVGWGI